MAAIIGSNGGTGGSVANATKVTVPSAPASTHARELVAAFDGWYDSVMNGRDIHSSLPSSYVWYDIDKQSRSSSTAAAANALQVTIDYKGGRAVHSLPVPVPIATAAPIPTSKDNSGGYRAEFVANINNMDIVKNASLVSSYFTTSYIDRFIESIADCYGTPVWSRLWPVMEEANAERLAVSPAQFECLRSVFDLIATNGHGNGHDIARRINAAFASFYSLENELVSVNRRGRLPEWENVDTPDWLALYRPTLPLSSLFHQWGINMRHLSLVRQRCHDGHLRTRLLVEMVQRTLKQLLRTILRSGIKGTSVSPSSATSSTSTNNNGLYDRIAMFLNTLLSSNAAGGSDGYIRFWRHTLPHELRQRFGDTAISSTEEATIRDTIASSMNPILFSVMNECGVKISSWRYHQLLYGRMLSWDTAAERVHRDTVHFPSPDIAVISTNTCIRSQHAFTTGRHYVQVRVAKWSGHGTIQVGLVSGHVSPRYDGHDLADIGWSYGSDGMVGEHKRTSHTYGGSFMVGAVIGMRLDLNMGTLSYIVNGMDQGIAFRNITAPVHVAVTYTSAPKHYLDGDDDDYEGDHIGIGAAAPSDDQKEVAQVRLVLSRGDDSLQEMTGNVPVRPKVSSSTSTAASSSSSSETKSKPTDTPSSSSTSVEPTPATASSSPPSSAPAASSSSTASTTSSSSTAPQPSATEWTCAQCTYANPMSAFKCELCDGRRPTTASSSSSSSSSSHGATSGLPVEFTTGRKLLEDGHIFEGLAPSSSFTQTRPTSSTSGGASSSSSSTGGASSSSSNGNTNGAINEPYQCAVCTYINPPTARSCGMCNEPKSPRARRGRALGTVISESSQMMIPSEDEKDDTYHASLPVAPLTAADIIGLVPVITIPRRIQLARLVTLVDRAVINGQRVSALEQLVEAHRASIIPVNSRRAGTFQYRVPIDDMEMDEATRSRIASLPGSATPAVRENRLQLDEMTDLTIEFLALIQQAHTLAESLIHSGSSSDVCNHDTGMTLGEYWTMLSPVMTAITIAQTPLDTRPTAIGITSSAANLTSVDQCFLRRLIDELMRNTNHPLQLVVANLARHYPATLTSLQTPSTSAVAVSTPSPSPIVDGKSAEAPSSTAATEVSWPLLAASMNDHDNQIMTPSLTLRVWMCVQEWCERRIHISAQRGSVLRSQLSTIASSYDARWNKLRPVVSRSNGAAAAPTNRSPHSICMVLSFRDQLSLCLGQYGYELRIPFDTNHGAMARAGSTAAGALRAPDCNHLISLYRMLTSDDARYADRHAICLVTPYGRAVPLSLRADGATVVALPYGRAILHGPFKTDLEDANGDSNYDDDMDGEWAQSNASSSSSIWYCDACTSENRSKSNTCGVCGTRRGKGSTAIAEYKGPSLSSLSSHGMSSNKPMNSSSIIAGRTGNLPSVLPPTRESGGITGLSNLPTTLDTGLLSAASSDPASLLLQGSDEKDVARRPVVGIADSYGSSASASTAAALQEWECGSCTYINKGRARRCEICDTPRG